MRPCSRARTSNRWRAAGRCPLTNQGIAEWIFLCLRDTILHNAKVATNGVPSFVEAVAITDGTITAVGTNDEILRCGARGHA